MKLPEQKLGEHLLLDSSSFVLPYASSPLEKGISSIRLSIFISPLILLMLEGSPGEAGDVKKQILLSQAVPPPVGDASENDRNLG